MSEREAACALEGGAVGVAWPGLLEPSYLMGPSYSTLRVSDLWPGHSSLGVSMQVGQVGREQPMKPGQRGRGLEEGHDDQAERR